MRIAARWADGANQAYIAPSDYRHKNDVLDAHCAEIGRDPAEIRRSWQFYLKTPDEMGNLRNVIQPYLDTGIDHVCIGVPPEYHPDIVKRLAEEVAPLLG